MNRITELLDLEDSDIVVSDIRVEGSTCSIAPDPVLCGQDITVPQNGGFDAAAAGDHMLLMAHALGLGGVWLSKTVESKVTKNTAQEFKEKYGLPDFIEIALHLAIGWPALQTIKSKRMPLEKMIITRDTFKK